MLSIPTNVLLIIGSSLGYFFFSGLSTFALLFVRGHYHAEPGNRRARAADARDRLDDRNARQRPGDRCMVRRGFLEARMWVPAICYGGAAVLLIPGVLGSP